MEKFRMKFGALEGESCRKNFRAEMVGGIAE